MKKSFLAFIVIAFVFVACKKNQTGGEAELSCTVAHHGKLIPASKIYIKYGAKESPGTDVSKYDAEYTTGIIGETRAHTHIHDLRYGNYYLYAIGYDSAISMPVSGGIPVSIKWKERKEEKEIEVPVTE